MEAFSEAFSAHQASSGAAGQETFNTRETGVFVGVSQLEYARISLESSAGLNAYYATGAHLSVASGRLSYTFGFKGPAVTVDTACSSSLVTTHLASRALHAGDCTLAGSVGVNLTLVHSWTRACLRAGMLAEDGRCKTLDAGAGGYVRAEAVGALVLALAGPSSRGAGGQAPWHSLAVLAGSAVNQDGRSSSLTAPNGPAQQDVMHAALRSGDLAAADMQHLQMHGTGEGWAGGALIKKEMEGVEGHSKAQSHRCPRTALLSNPNPLASSLETVLQAPPWETPSRWGLLQRRCCGPAPPGPGPCSSLRPSPSWATLSPLPAWWGSRSWLSSWARRA